MPLMICFPFKTGKVCINVPVLLPNPPGPDPDPWINGLELPKEELGSIVQLATIAFIVEKMPAASQTLLAPMINQAVEVEAKKLSGAVFNWHRGGPGPDPAFTKR